jgi:hypothetical protein
LSRQPAASPATVAGTVERPHRGQRSVLRIQINAA